MERDNTKLKELLREQQRISNTQKQRLFEVEASLDTAQTQTQDLKDQTRSLKGAASRRETEVKFYSERARDLGHAAKAFVTALQNLPVQRL